MTHHPAVAGLLRFFTDDHLPDRLANVSRPFRLLAEALASDLAGPELSVALRKLLEAKDAALRAALAVQDDRGED
jgi:hypothetical protein